MLLARTPIELSFHRSNRSQLVMSLWAKHRDLLLWLCTIWI